MTWAKIAMGADSFASSSTRLVKVPAITITMDAIMETKLEMIMEMETATKTNSTMRITTMMIMNMAMTTKTKLNMGATTATNMNTNMIIKTKVRMRF